MLPVLSIFPTTLVGFQKLLCALFECEATKNGGPRPAPLVYGINAPQKLPTVIGGQFPSLGQRDSMQGAKTHFPRTTGKHKSEDP